MFATHHSQHRPLRRVAPQVAVGAGAASTAQQRNRVTEASCIEQPQQPGNGRRAVRSRRGQRGRIRCQAGVRVAGRLRPPCGGLPQQSSASSAVRGGRTPPPDGRPTGPISPRVRELRLLRESPLTVCQGAGPRCGGGAVKDVAELIVSDLSSGAACWRPIPPAWHRAGWVQMDRVPGRYEACRSRRFTTHAPRCCSAQELDLRLQPTPGH